MKRLTRVALVLGTLIELERLAARGVAAYAHRNRRPWVFHPVEPRFGPEALDPLRDWNPDGIIVHMWNPGLAQAVCELAQARGIPLINVINRQPIAGLRQVVVDEQAVGETAGRHLLDRGFRHLAFLGWRPRPWSEARGEGFARAVAAARRTCHRLELTDDPYRRFAEDPRVAAWVAGLPKPVGIFACSDRHGFELAEVCRRAGLEVPEEVALVGVDNDEPWCSLAYPQLSSVISPAEQIGVKAAAMLDEWLAGRPPEDAAIALRPPGVAQRGSTDVVAIADRAVATAVRFIRDRRAVTVRDVVAQNPLSRRALEKRFRLHLGRTPLEEILRVRIEHVKELLTQTDLPMAAIARQCGFRNPNRFSETFHREQGQTPSQFRRQCHGG